MNTGHVIDKHGTRLDYVGPPLELGPLPAFFYFALSGEESLHLHPYNSPVMALANEPIRIFSLTLPAHGEGFNKLHAMQKWADWMADGSAWLEGFFQNTLFAIHWLIGGGFVIPTSLALGGLSRGGLIATHIAARLENVSVLLAFAPLTRLNELKEFSETGIESANAFDLETLSDKLLHVQHLRFYIGNNDTRVGTDACYRFIRTLAKNVHEKHVRHCQIELMITPSLGHKGHGTAPHIFVEGAQWIKQQLLGK